MALSLVELIARITKLLSGVEDNFLVENEKAGLTAKQLNYIDAIDELGNPNYSELAKKLALSKPSVTAIINKFIENGYVVKSQADDDRRSFHIHLSEKGLQIVKQHDALHKKIAGILNKALTEEEVKQLVNILNKMISKFNDLV